MQSREPTPRQAGRVLVIDPAGRVLLLQGFDPARPDSLHWITIGGGPEGALQWHFLAMWILAANGIAYLAYGFYTGRFRRMLDRLSGHATVSRS